MRRAIVVALLMGFGSLVVCPPVLAQSFNFTTIDFPRAVVTGAGGINKAGDIVGFYLDSNGASHGFLDEDGEFATIDLPGAIGTSANGINDRGEIVGSFTDGSGSHGFVNFKKKFTTIDFPGAVSTFANGVNKRGQIVGSNGFSIIPPSQSFLRTPGGGLSTIDLPLFGSGDVVANGIDDDGAIVGQCFCAAYPVGFLYDGDTVTIIDPTVGGALRIASASAISSGVIVGMYVDAVPVPHTSHGYVRYPSGGVTELKLPDGTPAFPGGINSEGQIVGSYTDSSGVQHGFLAIPQ